ncbi:pyridine nucleotide-disulfide oxidoreductase [Salegentibacter salinarum]|uniref:Pyridine nucleotide-disulfide oxidoreductase n=1 Tax=Salegentibacter salinarum TaxID=447422 RepID=A0A2N0U3S6_9FLAO|nr:NAD(P)/FAD-dependent oxidoreductase [Salegentibacter salinarum]PKD21662.1 pyridine nucleotide-disulfide oxidoreductase [Salegentibacter salinarum]SKB35240.1 Thioredoxin reductase [Salegentibacter salinarum]
MKTSNYDVIIIGGSYAGLSAAMALGRSMRKVLIIDSEKPCNQQTPKSHNFITQDGVAPGEISAIARKQVLEYKTVESLKDLAVGAKKKKNNFHITTKSNGDFIGKKLIFATGIKDMIPEIKGFKECWGISMIHCPYCHGYEFRNKRTGILTNGDRAFHLASLVKNLTDKVSILTNGNPDFTQEQIAKLKANNVDIIENKISELEHKDGAIKSLIFTDGKEISFDAIYAGFPFEQHSSIPVSLGCELTEHGYIKINELQQTTIEGVYSCGDNSAMMRSVASAVASGNLTGAMVNHNLTQEQF